MTETIYIRKPLSSDFFYIYTKPKGKRWLLHVIRRITDPKKRFDTWRIEPLSAVDLVGKNPLENTSFTNVNELTVHGVWTHAFIPNGETWVGSTHGYEEELSHLLSIDGIPVNMEQGEVLAGKEISLIVKSNLLKPSDGSVLAENTIEYRYTSEHFKINDEITWKQNIGISTFYSSMCPFKRDPNASQKGRLYNETTVQNMKTTGFPLVQKDSRGAVTWSENNQTVMSMEILNPLEALNNYQTNGSAKTYFSNSDSYNKLYFTRVNNEIVDVSIGETWRCNSKFTAHCPE